MWYAPKAGGGLGAPMLVPELSSAGDEIGAVVSADGLWAYVSSDRTDLGSEGSVDIFLAHRPSRSVPFGPLVLQKDLSTTGSDRANWLSLDMCRLYIESDANGQNDLYVAEKSP